MRIRLGVIGLAAVALASLRVSLAEGVGANRFNEVIENFDPLAIEAFLESSGRDLTPAQTALAQGVVASMRSRNSLAVEKLLQTLKKNPTPLLRRQALTLLGAVYLRMDRYRDAAQALDTALSLSAFEPALTMDELSGLEQTRDTAAALKDVQPQTQQEIHPGSAPIDRDWGGLMRIEAAINGTKQDVVLDTGASYSTVTESTARRLKLRILEAPITVGSAAVRKLSAKLAVADNLEIAGNTFRNVVAIVVEDDSLSFAWGLYTIDAIIGFPVLSRLGRIEVTRVDGDDILRVAAPATGTSKQNLYFRGTRPVAMLEMLGAGRLSMHVDTGSVKSSLNERFARAFPERLAGLPEREAKMVGAGGSKTIHIRKLPNVEFSINDVIRPLESISVTDEDRKEDGRLGQDVLGADRGFALDLSNMQITFLGDK